ncbi:hypothetical protein DFJ63DRAFT_336248 [Scheffersomyces coipomensis]|uniref:uncharacterized protein n=1 Tax=Scheffersomyces coipomensis TaxID=1788519 RepID=UPI00315CC879
MSLAQQISAIFFFGITAVACFHPNSILDKFIIILNTGEHLLKNAAQRCEKLKRKPRESNTPFEVNSESNKDTSSNRETSSNDSEVQKESKVPLSSPSPCGSSWILVANNVQHPNDSIGPSTVHDEELTSDPETVQTESVLSSSSSWESGINDQSDIKGQEDLLSDSVESDTSIKSNETNVTQETHSSNIPTQPPHGAISNDSELLQQELGSRTSYDTDDESKTYPSRDHIRIKIIPDDDKLLKSQESISGTSFVLINEVNSSEGTLKAYGQYAAKVLGLNQSNNAGDSQTDEGNVEEVREPPMAHRAGIIVFQSGERVFEAGQRILEAAEVVLATGERVCQRGSQFCRDRLGIIEVYMPNIPNQNSFDLGDQTYEIEVDPPAYTESKL